jgi:hypothetical protein
VGVTALLIFLSYTGILFKIINHFAHEDRDVLTTHNYSGFEEQDDPVACTGENRQSLFNDSSSFSQH